MPGVQTVNRSWKKLNKRMAEKPNANVFCHIPICVGYQEGLSPEELAAVIKAIERKNNRFRKIGDSREIKFKIYLDIKDEKALEQWKLDNAELIRKFNVTNLEDPNSQIVLLSVYKQQERWKRAFERRSAYLQDPARKEEYKKIVAGDIDNLQAWARKKYKDATAEDLQDPKHPRNWTPADNEACVISEAITLTSFFVPMDDPSEEIHAVLYANNFHRSVSIVSRDAEDMGYKKDSFLHVKLEFSAANQFAKKLRRWALDLMSYLFKAEVVDSAYVAEFEASIEMMINKEEYALDSYDQADIMRAIREFNELHLSQIPMPDSNADIDVVLHEEDVLSSPSPNRPPSAIRRSFSCYDFLAADNKVEVKADQAHKEFSGPTLAA